MTDVIKINSTRALLLLEEAVAERGPDFIYGQPTRDIWDQEQGQMVPTRGCWYELNDCASCGVGAALLNAGVPMDVLKAMDNEPGDTSILATDHILSSHNVHLTPGALQVFSQFQSEQDLETPWGEALQSAATIAKEQS